VTTAPLIEIEGLRVLFHGDDGRTTHAVDRVDLSVADGATLGLVGESGCGKSVTSLAIMGLLSKQSAEVTGSIRFDGFDLLQTPDQTLRDLRGRVTTRSLPTVSGTLGSEPSHTSASSTLSPAANSL